MVIGRPTVLEGSSILPASTILLRADFGSARRLVTRRFLLQFSGGVE